MSDVTTLATTEASPPAGRSRRSRVWRGIGAGVLVAAAIAGGITWRVLGSSPRITFDGFGQLGPGFTTLDDGISDTKVVAHLTPGRDYPTTVSIANQGRFTVTLLGLDQSALALFDPTHDAVFIPNPDSNTSQLLTRATQRTVTLKPGQQAGVRVIFRANACWVMSQGAYAVMTDIPLRVRQLSVTTTQRVHVFDLPMYLTTTQDPNALPARCASGQITR